MGTEDASSSRSENIKGCRKGFARDMESGISQVFWACKGCAIRETC